MNRPVVVRFAPSPTGPLHIGGVRTCLYNYLFARQHGGKLLFRIEDTDSQRFVPGAEEYIIESFKWLGIQFDEGVSFGGDHGPYRQSERREIYKKYVQVLLDAGKAYYAFDTKEELDAARAATPNFQYDATTRGQMRNSVSLGMDKALELIAAGEPYVVRFLIEPGEDVVVNDLIRGEVKINSSILDDKVLYKSADELPTYHMANIVDDHLMEVTHVIRGEDWLPSLPKHIQLFRYLGFKMPKYLHTAQILKTDENGGKKNCRGKDGQDIIIKVPRGTVIRDAQSEKVIVDMSGDTNEYKILTGGRGGLGNQHYATSTMQAPKSAQPGKPSKEMEVILELKLIADVGLIGFPSVGKSSFLANAQ